MRVVIQDIQNYRFFCGEGHWTGRIESARSFKNSVEAIEFIVDHGLEGVQIALRFSGEEWASNLRHTRLAKSKHMAFPASAQG